MTYLVDSHCHLNMVAEKGIAIEEAVRHANDNDVKLLVTICTTMSESEEVLGIAKQHANVYASVGIHPHEVDKEATTVEDLVRIAQNPKIIGIGETGLDYYYEHSKRETQAESFRTHIAAAQETACPVIIHSRDADEDTVKILAEEMKKGDFPFLIHCFTGTEALANGALELGGYISISGIVTFKNSTELQGIVKGIPLDRLLVETDAPFLAPVPHRGKVNQPGYTRHTAEFIAELRGISFAELADATTENFFRLFSKAARV